MNEAMIVQLLGELEGSGSENAACALLALGPAVVLPLRRHFAHSASATIRKGIVEIIGRLRRPDDLGFFALALRDSDARVWQAAIDALVSQPGDEALLHLCRAFESESAFPRRNSKKVSFLEEAISELRKPRPFGAGRPV